MKRLAALLALLLILAACSGDESGEGALFRVTGGEAGESGTPGADEDSAADSEAPGQVDVAFDVIDDRKVIRRANFQLHSSDTRQTYDEIVSLAESVGGFVASANVFPFEGDENAQPDVAVTLRIPADQLTSVMDSIRDSVDEVVSESQGAQDVTDQFVDLDARLRNLKALEIELRALLEEVRQQPDADPQKLLTVFNELSSVRGQIEQIQGQLNVLANLTALATLEIHISQTPKAAPIVGQPWEPLVAAREALSSLVTSLQDVADWAINFALFVLPMLLLTIGIPVAIGYTLYRRYFGRGRKQGPPTTPTPAES